MRIVGSGAHDDRATAAERGTATAFERATVERRFAAGIARRARRSRCHAARDRP